MERRKFTWEFKLEAVRLIKERGVSYAQASLDLGVHQSQLRGWVKALADDPQHAFPGQGQCSPKLKRVILSVCPTKIEVHSISISTGHGLRPRPEIWCACRRGCRIQDKPARALFSVSPTRAAAGAE